MATCWHVSFLYPQLITPITLILLINLALSACASGQSTLCRYTFPNKTVVDLQQTLETLQNDRFSIVDDSLQLFYNPCRNIHVNANCMGVVGCVGFNLTDVSSFIGFGDVNKGEFKLDELNNQLYLTYSSQEQNSHLTVRLLCSGENDAKLTLDNKNTTELNLTRDFNLTLSSKCCCADKCLRTPHHPSSSLSTGSVLVIILAVILMVYFVGGMLFLHFFKGANGLEMIPHYEFWIDLPVLIKDGIVFTLNGCKAEASYDRI